MKLECIFRTARSATLRLADGGKYETMMPYRLLLNGQPWGEAARVITSLFGLLPETVYRLDACHGDMLVASATFETDAESYTLDVRRFGAIGDGVHDDTAAIQAAIHCCPPQGRVRVPRGRYLVSPLFLKSHLRLEIEAGAALCLMPDRARLPILPGVTESFDEQDELCLGTWEGNPLDMYAALLTGVDVQDVIIYGEGLLDGQAQLGDWWQNPKVRRGAWRGRLLFLCRCQHVTVQGLSFQNSPSWHLHPYFSQHLAFYGIRVTAPAGSPNTDGFDPESCRDVAVAGAYFALGDDCIAIKSGKLYMGSTYQTPSEDIRITHCLMENGHGGVTIGSEMAGGVRDVLVRDCVMRHTDRGLRIKTRRGRGRHGVIDNIRFENVDMQGVGVPCTVNAMYFCDPDGHSPYVQARGAMPVDEGTPTIGLIAFADVRAEDCGACAAYFLGLPERPIGEVHMARCTFTFAGDAAPMQPIMAEGVAPCARRGLVAQNVARIVCTDVTLDGQDMIWEEEA